MVKKRPFCINIALTSSRHGRPSLRIGGFNGIAMLPTIDLARFSLKKFKLL